MRGQEQVGPIYLIPVAASRGKGDALASGKTGQEAPGFVFFFYQQILVTKLQNTNNLVWVLCVCVGGDHVYKKIN